MTSGRIPVARRAEVSAGVLSSRDSRVLGSSVSGFQGIWTSMTLGGGEAGYLAGGKGFG